MGAAGRKAKEQAPKATKRVQGWAERDFVEPQVMAELDAEDVVAPEAEPEEEVGIRLLAA